jgi:pSer/pThr/pTyr-binding forkhead associated (FHA) protein
MPTLIVTSGPGEGTYYPLGKRTTVVGRHETCALQVLDEKVSGKHCQIRFEEFDKSYRLLDMKSTNGTLVHGRKLEGELTLQEDDEIQIGNARLLFTNQDFPDKASAALYAKKAGQKNRPTIEQR